MRPKTTAARVAALVCVSWCVAAGVAHADPPRPPGPTPGGPAPASPAPASPAAPGQPKTTIGADGTYAVGTDIVPGTYSSGGPAGDTACYWKRIKGDEIVDNSMSKKPQVVQIDPTDTAFRTSHCQPWQLTDCPPDCPPPPQAPPPGLGLPPMVPPPPGNP